MPRVLVKILFIAFFIVFLFNTFSIAQAVCSDCNPNNYETGDQTCACDQWEECKDIYHKSTAYVAETGQYGTDYCLNENTVREYYINCKLTWPLKDSLNYEDIKCPSGYGCADGTCVYTGCSYNPSCGYSYWSNCETNTYYKSWYLRTGCNGGCEYDPVNGYIGAFSCGTGKYCSGWKYEGSPCYSCSNSCDGKCQASTCYGTDPDCDSNGNPTLACCGNGICNTGESFSNCPSDCKLGEGQGDCDSNSDCKTGLYCSCVGYCSGLFDWDTDYCCSSGSYWNGTTCHTPKPSIRVEPSSLVFNR